MKQTFLIAIASILLHLFSNDTHAQCYRCGSDSSSWEPTRSGAAKVLKKLYPETGKVKWYQCEFGYTFGVEYFKDSSKTYFFSPQNEWLGTETRYLVKVKRYFEQGEEFDPNAWEQTTCTGPNILPVAIQPLVRDVFGIPDLDTLNQTDGTPFWVCDIFKVELPVNHPVCQHERTTTFYVVSMDFVFHVYTEYKEIFFPGGQMSNHGFLYSETEYIYENGQVEPVPPVEHQIRNE